MERASSRAFEVGEAGDVNGDGRVDVLVGAYGADNNAYVNLGSAYVAYGLGAPALSYPGLVATVGTAIAPLVPTLARTGLACRDRETPCGWA